MKATADTNVLLRAVLDDHPGQSAAARKVLAEAELVALTLPTLCEFVWVLRQGYGRSRQDVSTAIEAIMTVENIILDRPAVAAGLSLMAAGGDFADGVIAFEGARLGGETLVTFDRDAAQLLKQSGIAASLLPS